MNSRAAKMLQELQELLLILGSACISLFMPVNLIFFGVFLGVGGGGGCLGATDTQSNLAFLSCPLPCPTATELNCDNGDEWEVGGEK